MFDVVTDDRVRDTGPRPSETEASEDFKAIRESQRGFMVMADEPAQPIDIVDQAGGPPAPDQVDMSSEPADSATDTPE
jgi:hypothetical protein